MRIHTRQPSHPRAYSLKKTTKNNMVMTSANGSTTTILNIHHHYPKIINLKIWQAHLFVLITPRPKKKKKPHKGDDASAPNTKLVCCTCCTCCTCCRCCVWGTDSFMHSLQLVNCECRGKTPELVLKFCINRSVLWTKNYFISYFGLRQSVFILTRERESLRGFGINSLVWI